MRLSVVAAAILDERKVLLVSKQGAPGVFYLPGGKPDGGEDAERALRRELREELGVTLVHAEPLAVVHDEAALERTPMELRVFLAEVAGDPAPQAEITAMAWVGSDGAGVAELAPAIRNHVLPLLGARQLID